MAEPPAVEVLRGQLRPDGTPDVKSLHVVQTIPGALLLEHAEDDRVVLLDPITAEETRAHFASVSFRLAPSREVISTFGIRSRASNSSSCASFSK